MDDSKACARCQSQSNLKLCARCKSTSYCSKDCQTAHWKTHKHSCEPLSGSNATQSAPRSPPSNSAATYQDGLIPNAWRTLASYIPGGLFSSPGSSTSSTQIWGVKLLPGNGFMRSPPAFTGPQARFVPEFFGPSHPIFTHGELCPFTVLYSIPIILYSPTIVRGVDGRGNQPAIYLRIEPKDGFAPTHWQIGSPDICYAVRQDRKPLDAELLETMYSFHASLLSSTFFEKVIEFGTPPYRITPEVFKTFSDEYWKEQRQEGRTAQSAVDGSDSL